MFNYQIIKVRGTIKFTIDKDHPDFDEGLKENHAYEITDIWRFDTEHFEEDWIDDHIKEDLLLQAGGGYDWNHVHNVEFIIEEISRENK